MRVRRLSSGLAALAVLLMAGTALAQPAPPPPPPGAAPAPAPVADPVVAKVDGFEIRLSDVTELGQALPDEMRGLPPTMLYPLLVDQLVDKRALLVLAKKRGLERDAGVIRAVERAQEQAMQNAVMSADVGPLVSDAALRARYERDVMGKPGEEEVRARHILVANEADALKIIAELKRGADFATLAKARSSDPGAAQGGDLGFFKRGEMVPEFAEAAFSLKPGQVSDKPVKTQFGWHVIRAEERRTGPAPAFEAVRDELRQKAIQEGVEKVLATARTGLVIEKFNTDGSPVKPTDVAQPPAAPKKP
jgi:peptidyl-prolyl cis-trans isomerase C